MSVSVLAPGSGVVTGDEKVLRLVLKSRFEATGLHVVEGVLGMLSLASLCRRVKRVDLGGCNRTVCLLLCTVVKERICACDCLRTGESEDRKSSSSAVKPTIS